MLTDEEIMDIRNRARLNDNRQIDAMAFARQIERAVLAKAGEQEPDFYVTPDGLGFEGYASISKTQDSGSIPVWLNAHPLPAQAIPDKQYIIDPRIEDGEYYLLGSDINKLLSASQKP